MTNQSSVNLPSDLSGVRVTLMGLGRFGGGVAAARFLAENGAKVTITDLRDELSLADSLKQLDGLSIREFIFEAHRECDFTSADLIVANPAVKPSSRFLQLAAANSIPIETEISLFCKFNPANVIAVTGSNGKSTTTALIGHVLRRTNRQVFVGGNIGRSLLPELAQIQSKDLIVLELSSFQLHHLDRSKFRPHVSVVTSLSPNHLDWHESMDKYQNAKQTVARWQRRSDTLILPSADHQFDGWPGAAIRRWFGTTDTGEPGVYCSENQLLLRTESGEEAWRWPETNLRGDHNRNNICAAISAAVAVGDPVDQCVENLSSFESLPHRLQLVRTLDERRFFNDSISTTPESTIAAVNSFQQPGVFLIGGYDKQIALDSMAKLLAGKAKAVVLMGQTTPNLQRLLVKYGFTNIIVAQSIEDAVQNAYDASSPGDVVVLSPGCASYDWFTNFEERGNRFVRAVNALKER